MSSVSVGLVVAAIATASACGNANRVTTGNSRRSVCAITAAELRETGRSSLYDALVAVRPALLRRNVHEDEPIVVVDGAVSASGSMSLQTIAVKQVAVVRRLSAAQAAQQYMSYYGHPVIEVFTVYSRESVDSSRVLGC